MNIQYLKSSSGRIWAMTMRHLYLQFKDGYKIIDAFFWPLYDLVIWGFTSAWLVKADPSIPLVKTLLAGVVLWTLMYRNSIEISVNVLEEVWNRALVNFFATPLNAIEWIASLMVVAFLRSWLTLGFCILMAKVLYGVNLLSLGWPFIFSIIMLILNGWIVGFFASGLIIRWGQKAQAIAWPMAWILAPFMGVFFPTTVLPKFLFYISKLFPATYIFNGMREYILNGHISYTLYGLSILMTIVYLLFALWFFNRMFERAKEQGLARLCG